MWPSTHSHLDVNTSMPEIVVFTSTQVPLYLNRNYNATSLSTVLFDLTNKYSLYIFFGPLHNFFQYNPLDIDTHSLMILCCLENRLPHLNMVLIMNIHQKKHYNEHQSSVLNKNINFAQKHLTRMCCWLLNMLCF